MGAGELFIRPVDLAKADRPDVPRRRALARRADRAGEVDRALDCGSATGSLPNCGLLWWLEGNFARTLNEPLLAWWRELGVNPATLKQARTLVGKKFKDGSRAARAALEKTLGKVAYAKLLEVLGKGDHVPRSVVIADGPVTGYSARGWLGKYLVVLPKAGIVAVRMRESEYSDYLADEQRHGYDDFAKDAASLL